MKVVQGIALGLGLLLLGGFLVKWGYDFGFVNGSIAQLVKQINKLNAETEELRRRVE